MLFYSLYFEVEWNALRL